MSSSSSSTSQAKNKGAGASGGGGVCGVGGVCSSSSSSFRRLDAGSRTVEGNVSGSRAAALEKKRLQDAENFEAQKRQRLVANSSNVTSLSNSFRAATKASAAEQAFSNQVVGLVTVEEFMAAATTASTTTAQKQSFLPMDKKTNGNTEESNEPQETELERQKREKAEQKSRKRKLKEKKKQMSTLSFAGAEEEEEENEEENQRRHNNKLKKDPTVDTSFLFDANRDEAQVRERKRLEQEWIEQQEAMKKEKLEITYSYWDGSGHRRSLVCQKGDSIGTFLQYALTQLGKEFRNLQGLTSDELIYIKEDLILPHDVTFYDLIATKARGKSGPLFYFDVHDDVRLGPIDTRVEKEESHPGKIVERKWYERNKHIFPASRWQVYDPTLETYGDYKIGGS